MWKRLFSIISFYFQQFAEIEEIRLDRLFSCSNGSLTEPYCTVYPFSAPYKDMHCEGGCSGEGVFSTAHGERRDGWERFSLLPAVVGTGPLLFLFVLVGFLLFRMMMVCGNLPHWPTEEEEEIAGSGGSLVWGRPLTAEEAAEGTREFDLEEMSRYVDQHYFFDFSTRRLKRRSEGSVVAERESRRHFPIPKHSLQWRRRWNRVRGAVQRQCSRGVQRWEEGKSRVQEVVGTGMLTSVVSAVVRFCLRQIGFNQTNGLYGGPRKPFAATRPRLETVRPPSTSLLPVPDPDPVQDDTLLAEPAPEGTPLFALPLRFELASDRPPLLYDCQWRSVPVVVRRFDLRPLLRRDRIRMGSATHYNGYPLYDAVVEGDQRYFQQLRYHVPFPQGGEEEEEEERERDYSQYRMGLLYYNVRLDRIVSEEAE